MVGTDGGEVDSAGPHRAAGRSWDDPGRVAEYLERVGRSAPRAAGEEVLASALPAAPRRVLDLGCGDGRLAALVLAARPGVAEVVALDVSPPMLERARERFAGDPRVRVGAHDLAQPLGDLGAFDVVVSGFAIHHLPDERKRALYGEVAARLVPGGLCANLEVVASATPELHAAFRAAVGRADDDPDDRLVDVETQLGWLREVGLGQVDCLWRWRGFALLVGEAPPGGAVAAPPAAVPAAAPVGGSWADGSSPPAVPPPPTLGGILDAVPPAGSPGPDAVPARSLAEALAGIVLPCDLAPLTHAGVDRPGALDVVNLVTDVDAVTVARALAAELARLGYTVTSRTAVTAVAQRGATVVQLAVEGGGHGAVASAAERPRSRRELRKAGAQARPGFGTAPSAATVVQLWL